MINYRWLTQKMQSWTSSFDPTKPFFRIAVKPKMTILGKASFRQNDSNSDDSRPLLDSSSIAVDPETSDPSSSDSTTIKMPTSAASTSSSVGGQQSDFVFIKIVARITLQLIRKFWAFSSAAVLAIVLFYWLCGGIVAFAFVTFAVSGGFVH